MASVYSRGIALFDIMARKDSRASIRIWAYLSCMKVILVFVLLASLTAKAQAPVTRVSTFFHVTEISRSVDAFSEALQPIAAPRHPTTYVWTVKGYADNKVSYVAACTSELEEQYVTMQDGHIDKLMPCPLPEVGKSYQVTIQRIGTMQPTIEFKSAIALPPNTFPGLYKVVGTPLANVSK